MDVVLGWAGLFSAVFVVTCLPILHWQRQDAAFFVRTRVPHRVWKNLFTFVLPFAGLYWWVTVARDWRGRRRALAVARR